MWPECDETPFTEIGVSIGVRKKKPGHSFKAGKGGHTHPKF